MSPSPQSPSLDGNIYFYPPEFYVFDNFSSFQINFRGKIYPTSEHAYQSIMFAKTNPKFAEEIRLAPSAHLAMKMAQEHKVEMDPQWDNIKIQTMKEILLCKVNQHEYVKRKLVQT